MTRKDFTHLLMIACCRDYINGMVEEKNKAGEKYSMKDLINNAITAVEFVCPFDDEEKQKDESRAKEQKENSIMSYSLNAASKYLDARCINPLNQYGIKTIGDLIDNIKCPLDAARIRGLGKQSVRKIMIFIDNYNKGQLSLI